MYLFNGLLICLAFILLGSAAFGELFLDNGAEMGRPLTGIAPGQEGGRDLTRVHDYTGYSNGQIGTLHRRSPNPNARATLNNMARISGEKFFDKWSGGSWVAKDVLTQYHDGFFSLTKTAHDLGAGSEDLARAARAFDTYVQRAESMGNRIQHMESVRGISNVKVKIQKAYSEPTLTTDADIGDAMLKAYRATLRRS